MRRLFLCLVLSAAAALGATWAVDGVWRGEIAAPQGPLEIALAFSRRTDGRIDLRLHLPSMHVHDARLGPCVVESDEGLAIPILDVVLRLEDGRLGGTFGKAHLPLALARGGVFGEAPTPVAENAGPAPLWRYALGAATFGSPVVRDGVAYVGAIDGTFHAVTTREGRGVWRWTGPRRIDGRAEVTADSVFFVDGACDLICLARADGRLRWRVALHDEAQAGGPPADNPTFNRRTATPLVRAGTVYVGSSDGGVYALDIETGSIRWRFAMGAPVFTGVTPLEDGSMLAGAMDGSVVRLGPDARAIWRMKTGGAVTATPVAADGVVVVGCRDYLLYGHRLEDGAGIWTYSYGFSWVESTPAVVGGAVYVGGSDWARVSEFEAKTGRTRWATSVGGLSWGTPLVTDDTVYAGTVCQRGALLPHRGGVVAIERRTGILKWRVEQGFPDKAAPFGGVPGSLARDDARILAAGFDGYLIALPGG
jgi:eukaryotic-like serine/threonine-protein kinase